MILELKDVQAYYDKSHILNGVNLSVEEGTSVCLLGRNGVGKSTTMKTIMVMLNPKEHCKTEGSITFNGKELVGMQSHIHGAILLLQGAQVGLQVLDIDRYRSLSAQGYIVVAQIIDTHLSHHLLGIGLSA